MKKGIVVAALALACLWPAMVLAHVQNERSLYEDIQFSTAQKQIIYLRGISAISAPETGAQLFRPDAKLSRHDLAYWAGFFRASPEERETADPEALRAAATAKKLVPSIEGEATYADVNQAYFDGTLKLETLDQTMTREEFVNFLGGYLEKNADGPTLFEMAGATKGPVGVVEKAEARTQTHDGAETTVNFMTIGGQEYRVSHHPKMLYGPADLKLWQGKSIEDSWLLDEGGSPVLTIAALPHGSFSDEQIAGDAHGHAEAGAGGHAPVTAVSDTPLALALPIGGVAVLLVIGGWVFWRRKERS